MDAGPLTDSEAFAAIAPEDLAALEAALEEIDVEQGVAVTTDGEFGYGLFVIVAGEADVVIGGNVVARLGPGDVFGEIALLVTGRRIASVIAATPLRLLTMFDRDVSRLRHQIPLFDASLRGLAAKRLSA